MHMPVYKNTQGSASLELQLLKHGTWYRHHMYVMGLLRVCARARVCVCVCCVLCLRVEEILQSAYHGSGDLLPLWNPPKRHGA